MSSASTFPAGWSTRRAGAPRSAARRTLTFARMDAEMPRAARRELRRRVVRARSHVRARSRAGLARDASGAAARRPPRRRRVGRPVALRMVAALLDHRRRSRDGSVSAVLPAGENDTLAELCADAAFDVVLERRIATTLEYADADEACRAAFVGRPGRARLVAFRRRRPGARAALLRRSAGTVATRSRLPRSGRIRHRGGDNAARRVLMSTESAAARAAKACRAKE